MKRNIIRKKIRGLFKTQNLGILATLGRTYPYQSIVAFAASSNSKSIIFTTSRKTSKYRNLKNSARVSMFIDNRTNREEDFKDAIGLTALGNANELQGLQRKKAMSHFIRRHPGLKVFVSSPDCSIFIVRVKVYCLVMHFQKVIKERPETWK